MENFNRTNDVSKLIGCNTRNVAYRWDIFTPHLEKIPPGSKVLDFGAGSLRDTFELISQGFHVKSMDLDLEEMKKYEKTYSWPSDQFAPELFGELTDLERQKDDFSVILAFDVLEHLEDPAPIALRLRELLASEGVLICSVPNSISIHELFYRALNVLFNLTGKSRTPGVPHLQFKTPGGWRRFLESNGFEVIDHDIEIGFLVNTYFGFWRIPLLVASKLTRINLLPLMDIVAHPVLMRSINKLDKLTSKIFRRGYAWNLFVLGKHAE